MGVYEGLKDAAAVLREADKISQYQQILDAQKALLDMQKRIEELEVENKELHKQLETKGKLVAQDNMYWIEEEGKRDGPFCTSCWDSIDKLVRLHVSNDSGAAMCPTCKTLAKHGRAMVFYPPNNNRNPGR
jgi:hypothetical protein